MIKLVLSAWGIFKAALRFFGHCLGCLGGSPASATLLFVSTVGVSFLISWIDRWEGHVVMMFIIHVVAHRPGSGGALSRAFPNFPFLLSKPSLPPLWLPAWNNTKTLAVIDLGGFPKAISILGEIPFYEIIFCDHKSSVYFSPSSHGLNTLSHSHT